MTRITTLVVPSNDAALSEFVKLFDRSSCLVPVFYLEYDSKLVLKIKERGWLVYRKHLSLEDEVKSSLKLSKAWFRTFFVRFLDDSKLGCFVQTYLLRRYLCNRLIRNILNASSSLLKIIEEQNIKACLISTDRSVGIEASIMYLSKLNPIKIYVLSFAYSADYQSSIKLRGKSIYSYIYPRASSNKYHGKGCNGKLFFRPFEHLALNEIGVFPKNPWVLGMGHCDLMLVDSERERNRLISLGGEEEKYIVTGTVSHDCLYEANVKRGDIKTELAKRYSLAGEAIAIIALPQYYEHGLCDKEKHFYIINNLIKSVIGLGFEILISLHPKMNRNNYVYLEAEYGVVVLEQELSEVIVVADLFVSTYSSTIVWARMCNIPAVIFDFINLNYKDFYNELNFPVVKSFGDLSSTLTDIYSTDFIKHQRELDSKQLSPFDGKCLTRIEDIIRE
ncbi:polysialyltransferase family glycosyltransferase [Shewanella spartinae]|uniref:polysialyltransferase family glycosyltransferase n=1 Tax=Shewanella spartinae TaxID=2864205 RepID=UPI001C65A561|nr:polysialyltransferase family glycosyltransferase [Shewanella spartinae]QYJ95153.1 hypothetical protein K0I31_07160 [Shewanella spartinae]